MSSGRPRPALGAPLLLITDGYDGATVARVAAALDALPRGAATVQLRAKRLDGGALYAAAVALVAVTRPRGAALVVNDRVDVALAAGADGVHLPARGLPPADARRLVGERIVGVSTHGRDEAVAAARAGADYVVFGPVWPTANKGPAAGVAALADVVRAVAAVAAPRAPVAVLALGGVDAARAGEAVAAGAGVACIGAVLGADDPAAGARALAAAMR